ncbi:hypothetical protein [Novosphingobium kaempferiae]|uniref:hypothetical protein n=1 Tax=Novosphingobium kaempferiae TaxID=2896849 RepID=UPI001E3DD06E|nr:hypothetical protein [Novosphingobium kaempferiae]
MIRPTNAYRNDSRQDAAGGILDFLPAAALLLAGLVGLSIAWLLSGQPSGQYLVLTSPTASFAQTVNLVRRAGGTIAGTSALPNVLIAGAPRADFAATLHKAGAWLIVPLPPLAGCGDPTSLEQTP